MSHDDWPTLADIADTHQISLHTLHKRHRERRHEHLIEAWRERPQDPYRINPDHVGVLLSHGRVPPWKDPQILAEEYLFMCHSFQDERKAIKRLADAYRRCPETITRALRKTTP